MGKLAPHLSFANVTSVVALVMALGLGSAWAATEIGKNEVTSKAIKNGQVKGADLANDAVTSPKVGDGSLLAQDFAAGELPAGERGPAGPTGPDGPRGETGIQGPPGAPNPNAETLDGFDSSGFVRYGSTIPSGTTVRGTFGVFADDHDSGQSFSTTGRTFISLPAVAPVPLTNANVNLRAGSGLGDADPQCIDQGSDTPTAPPGKVCIYDATTIGNITSLTGQGASVLGGAAKFGFEIDAVGTSASGTATPFAAGSWAYTAP